MYMLTENQINFLNRACADTWTEENSVINVTGNIDISEIYFTEIPVQFGTVIGDFDCSYNKLTTLNGAPSMITGFFNCDHNKLTNLKGGPKEVGNFYSCESNQLTSLIGAPEICNNNFWCRLNPLTTLEGCPNLITNNMNCNCHKLLILYGIGKVLGRVNCFYNSEFNKWIIRQARNDVIFQSIEDIIRFIKDTQYIHLKTAPDEIRRHFSAYELNYVDNLS